MPARALAVLLLLTAIAGCAPDDTAAIAPRRAPGWYVTQTYGLVARIPRGLTYCPLPEGWVGSDHGTTVFLTPPAACAPRAGYPSTARAWSDDVPFISLYYGYDMAAIEQREDDPDAPPRTAEDAARESCQEGGAPLPDGLTLFAAPAAGCVHRDGDRVTVQVVGLYDASSPAELSVRLRTTGARLATDLRVFAKLVGSITPCRSRGSPSGAPVRCPAGGHWW